MTGIEVAVLVPFVYGCIHLGKKVLDQSRVINNQNAVIDMQREAIAALQSTSAKPEASSRWGGLLGSAVAVSGVVIAASALAYNTKRWANTDQHRGAPSPDVARGQGGPRSSPPIIAAAPHASYVPSLAKSEQEECKVCCEHRRDTLIMPCRHFALCWSCVERILSNAAPEKRCPVCRCDIESVHFTFVS